jgi:hypothetical protein
MYCCISSVYPLKNITSLWRPDTRFINTLSICSFRSSLANEVQIFSCAGVIPTGFARLYCSIECQCTFSDFSISVSSCLCAHERVNHHRFNLCSTSFAFLTNPLTPSLQPPTPFADLCLLFLHCGSSTLSARAQWGVLGSGRLVRRASVCTLHKSGQQRCSDNNAGTGSSQPSFACIPPILSTYRGDQHVHSIESPPFAHRR